MNVFAVNAIGISTQRRHDDDLLVVARCHEYKVPCPGQQLEVRRDWQLARQRHRVFVDGHQIVAVTAVKQHGHVHIGQRVATELQAQRRHQH